MTPRLLGALVPLLLVTACATDADDETPEAATEAGQVEEHWSHEHPEEWGEQCASGSRQSPIDLTDPEQQDLADIDFDYQPSAVTVANTGHTIQAAYGAGSAIGVDGTWFDLVQFHFHAPSEHTVDGTHAAAELHLVHQDDDGNLAVIGVLVEKGKPNQGVGPVLRDAPRIEGMEAEPQSKIDADDLLPRSLLTYRYDGSLTTPPCSEGVQWLMMAEPVTWSPAQLTAFTDLYDGSNRPVQPLGDREQVIDTTE